MTAVFFQREMNSCRKMEMGRVILLQGQHCCFAVFLCAVLCCLFLDGTSALQYTFTDEEFYAYSMYYKKLPGPLQQMADEGRFLVAKGAKMVVTEYNHRTRANYELRYIKNAHLSAQNDFVRYQLYVEDKGGQILEARFDAKVTLVANVSEIASSLLKAEILKIPAANECDKLSTEANCTKCLPFGQCEKGHVPVDSWLRFALHMQQEIQINQTFTFVEMPAAHNAFNNRADYYGVFDDCPWPPPYDVECIRLANQEFSLTDMLNMGIRSLELDPWWCFDDMRMSHATDRALGCGPLDRRFELGIQEIADWVHRPENTGKVIRIYLEDGAEHTEGHDDLINNPIKSYLGDRVFTPSDKEALGRWPTLRDMKQLNKTVLLTTDGSYTHGGMFIQDGYWTEHIKNDFTPYPKCGQDSSSSVMRYYCDSTNYGPFWDGPNKTGVILDFTEFMKCGVQYPAADQVSPKLLETAVWTWANGEPSTSLRATSCVYLNGTDQRWYLSPSCQVSLPSACANTTNASHWLLGAPGYYGQPEACPKTFLFGLPVNRFQQQKLVEVAGDQTVWINITPYIPQLSEEINRGKKALS